MKTRSQFEAFNKQIRHAESTNKAILDAAKPLLEMLHSNGTRPSLVGEGFAETCSEEQALALMNEAQGAATTLTLPPSLCVTSASHACLGDLFADSSVLSYTSISLTVCVPRWQHVRLKRH
ncbi:hypothetical protein E2562_012505 [Oryza meyeriana var. granulata]|uniref:Uncharacterized protein n=1 Tax=Oryza meyeriana var. granulata TaxID=110450 RepID=A0A6G1BXD8_9ORYZ|nr:hypothetical protein E2562_012505 [Oryza meyeriana var. granulata]